MPGSFYYYVSIEAKITFFPDMSFFKDYLPRKFICFQQSQPPLYTALKMS